MLPSLRRLPLQLTHVRHIPSLTSGPLPSLRSLWLQRLRLQDLAKRFYSQRPRRSGRSRNEDPHHNREFFEQESRSHGQGPNGNSPNPGGPQQFSWRDLILPGALLVFFTLLPGDNGPGNGVFRDITWQEFYNKMLSLGEVEKLVVSSSGDYVHVYLYKDAVIPGYNDVPGRRLPTFRVPVPSVHAFEDRMETASNDIGVDLMSDINVVYMQDNEMTDLLWGLLPVAVILGTWIFISRRIQVIRSTSMQQRPGQGGGNDPMNFGKMSALKTKAELPKTTFKDVAGLGEAKVELKEFVQFLQTPERFEKLGAHIPKGAILTGPPGTGKTLLAKAVAGEAGVPFFACSGSDFIEMFVGVGPSRVRDLFKQARESSPCIVYIDEIDAVARARSGANNSSFGGGNSERESTLNQLLVELDGVNSSEGCLVLASTNRADMMDKALLRPGRFDRQIACDLPTLLEREEIFEVHMRDLELAALDKGALRKHLAAITPGMSGAQIAAVCNEAALHAARHSRPGIQTADFDYAVDRVASGMERRSRVISQQEKEIIAYHEAGHALVSHYLKYTDPVMKISLIPRGNSLGVTQYLPNEHYLYSAEELMDRMATLLGGRVAESVHFGQITTGAQNDLQRVTQMAYAYVTQYGMSEAVGPVVFRIPQSANEGKKRMSNKTSQLLDEEASRIVEMAGARAKQLVEQHKAKLSKLATELIAREVLSENEVVEILGPKTLRE
eukprot:TRINITY_DN5926_c0_g1_i2.p1 TRINITY_DN5926_c0_g1~~TRINITY_DN5926_c0_g1_i2.p1  ORF type:complete len:727 (+),score=125.91 TRINITY_DN5926_c0_g1_i2:44-2224(+)